jgi:FkbM family methyltransferase
MNVKHAPLPLPRRIAARLRDTALEQPARHLRSMWWTVSRQTPQHVRNDEMTRNALQRMCTPRSNCVDIGAHRGAILQYMVEAAPLGKHMAFEPLPGYAPRLASLFPDVDVRAIALADYDGTATFAHVIDAPAYSGFMQRTDAARHLRTEHISVPVMCLDEVAPANRRIDVIKIDVEGAELAVLRGASSVLHAWRPYVIFEHGKGGADACGSAPELVFRELKRADLRVFRLRDWLDELAPLGESQFVAEYERNDNYMFVAAP